MNMNAERQQTPAVRPAATYRQAGVSLVELMVAILVGSIVIIATVQIFSANRQTFRMQDAMSVTQETGTFALDFIVRDLLRAGYPGYPSAAAAFDWTNTANNDANGNDTLAVIYAPDVAGNVLCTGDAAGGALRISNRYFVQIDPATNTGQLMCQGAVDNGAGFTPVGTPQVLVDNVESFQVLFGVDTVATRDPNKVGTATAACPDNPQEPTEYVNASLMAAVLAYDANPPNTCDAAMSELQVVRSVRIGLLVRTPGLVDVTVPSTQTYTVLDQVVGAPAIQPDDGHLRRLFTKTVSLRNSVENFL